MHNRSLPEDAGEIVPLAEEELTVGKRDIASGKVRIRTVVEVSDELVREMLRSETVEITRVPVGRTVEAAPAVRTEGEVLIVPVVEEVLVVEKQLVLREELHVHRRTVNEAVEAPVSLRKQRAIVERLSGDEPGNTDEEQE